MSADSVIPGASSLSIGPDKQSNGPANPQNLNRYTYVTNNPIKNTDPTGHCPWCIAGAVLGGIVGFAAYTYTHSDNFNWGHAAVWAGAGALAGGTLGFAGQAAVAAIATTEAVTVIAEGTAATGAAVAEEAVSEEGAIAEQAAQTLTKGVVYRGGSASISNLTPRPGIDETGLSTFRSLEQAVEPGGKAQVINVGKLTNLVAHLDDTPPGHVSIQPRDLSEISEWAATRSGSTPHPYTKEIMDAIIDVARRPK